MAGRGVEQGLDRECPQCDAAVGIKCRDSLRRRRRLAEAHIARGWLDRLCPSCRAVPGERCRTPSGRPAKVHRARWRQPRLAGESCGYALAAQFDYEDLRRQREALQAAGCRRVWTDRRRQVAGGVARRERAQLLAYLRRGDVLVVWRLDRLADTTGELAQLVGALRQRAIALRSLQDGLDSTLPGGEQLFAAIIASAALPADDVAAAPRDRQAERGHSTRPRGGGRPALLSERAHASVRAMYESGAHTIDQIAAAHGVSRPTVYRSLKRTASQTTL